MCYLGVNTGKQKGKKHLSFGVQRVVRRLRSVAGDLSQDYLQSLTPLYALQLYSLLLATQLLIDYLKHICMILYSLPPIHKTFVPLTRMLWNNTQANPHPPLFGTHDL